jgi:hypothetical protein
MTRRHTRKRRNEGTASISNDSDISASASASICLISSEQALKFPSKLDTYVQKEDFLKALCLLLDNFVEFLTRFGP